MLTRGLHQQAIFSFIVLNLEVGVGKMYQYMDMCVLMF